MGKNPHNEYIISLRTTLGKELYYTIFFLIYVCACLYVCVSAHTHVYGHMSKAEVILGCSFSNTVYHFETWSIIYLKLVKQASLASELSGFARLSLP